MTSADTLPPLHDGRRMITFDDSLYNNYGPNLERIRDAGANMVVFCVSESNLMWNAADKPNTSDLVLAFQEADKLGMDVAVDPWKVGNLFGGESASLTGGFKIVDGKPKLIPANPFGKEFQWMFDRLRDVCERAGVVTALVMDELDLKEDYDDDDHVNFVGRYSAKAHESGMHTTVFYTPVTIGRYGPLVAKLPYVKSIGADAIYYDWNTLKSNMPGTNDDSVEKYIGGIARQVSEIASANGIQGEFWGQDHSVAAGHEEAIIFDGLKAAAEHVNNLGVFRVIGRSNLRSDQPDVTMEMTKRAFQALTPEGR
jgi:hypothetical protein